MLSPGTIEAGVILTKKFIKVAIPAVRKASQITLDLVAGSPQGVKNLALSKRLDIVDNSLNLTSSFQENQFKMIAQKISDDLSIIKGQNEILFLSNSINYFIDSHRNRTGIDRGISYALQYDLVAVYNHLKKNKDLRFPGYLQHQIISLAETIKDLNIFYVSILQDGFVPVFDKQSVEEDLMKEFGVESRKGDFTASYIPFEIKNEILVENALKSNKKNTSFFNYLKERLTLSDYKEEQDYSHFALTVLKEELLANEQLEYQIMKRLSSIPEREFYVKSFTDEG